MFLSLFVCLFVCLLATLRKNFRMDLHEIFKIGNEPMNNWLNFGGDPDHRLDTGIVFRIRHYWQIWKVVSTDCTARSCSGGHTLAGIAIATMTSGRHRPLAEVCTIPVLLVIAIIKPHYAPTMFVFMKCVQRPPWQNYRPALFYRQPFRTILPWLWTYLHSLKPTASAAAAWAFVARYWRFISTLHIRDSREVMASTGEVGDAH